MSSQPSEHASALQTVLSSLGVLTVSQLVDLFNTYSAEPGFVGILQGAVPEIVGQHAQAAATVAAQWYDELAPEKPFQATAVTDLAPERVTKSIGWALNAPGDARPLDRLAGSAKRMVYDAARDTITENAAQENIGWARYAQPDACAFCRVLATRSGDNLYMSEHSAQFVAGGVGWLAAPANWVKSITTTAGVYRSPFVPAILSRPTTRTSGRSSTTPPAKTATPH
jgi:hypothetical protein